MNKKAKGNGSRRLNRKTLKDLGDCLLGVLFVVVIVGFSICVRVGSWFISPLVSVVRKKSRG